MKRADAVTWRRARSALSCRCGAVLAEPERGAAPVEMAITGLAAIGLIGLLVIGGRVAIASSSMSDVASAAARDASIARTAGQAQQLAHASAIATLTKQNLHCAGGPTITVDASGFAAPADTSASIRVDVTCVVSLSDVGMPGLPGSRTLHDQGTSPIDKFRAIGLGFGITDGPSASNRRVEVTHVAS